MNNLTPSHSQYIEEIKSISRNAVPIGFLKITRLPVLPEVLESLMCCTIFLVSIVITSMKLINPVDLLALVNSKIGKPGMP